MAARDTLADVAARYGATVSRGATVQRIPPGVSGFPVPVWNGSALVFPEGSGLSWRDKSATARRRIAALAERADVRAASARREQVVALHAAGMTDQAMAERLGVSGEIIARDRKVLGLPVHSMARQRAADRQARLRELVSAGHGDVDAADLMGMALRHVRALARECGIALRRTGPDRREPAPRGPRKRTAASIAAAARADRVAALHGDGLTDAAIAAITGFDPAQVQQARRARGLQAHRRRPLDDLAARIAPMAAAGMTDRAIADDLGLRLRRVRDVARAAGIMVARAGLDRQGVGRANLATARAEIQQRAAERRDMVRTMLADGVSTADMAERLGISRGAVGRIRRAMGLPLPPVDRVAKVARSRRVAEEWRERRVAAAGARAARVADLGAQGLTATQIAERMGITRSAVYNIAWKARIALPVDIRARSPKGRTGESAAVRQRRADVAQLRAAGLTIRAMALRLGVGKSTICGDLTALGVTDQRYRPVAERRAA